VPIFPPIGPRPWWSIPLLLIVMAVEIIVNRRKR